MDAGELELSAVASRYRNAFCIPISQRLLCGPETAAQLREALEAVAAPPA
jgi:hypothetical protein